MPMRPVPRPPLSQLPKTAGSFAKLVLKAGLEAHGTGSGAAGAWCPMERQGELYNACQPPIPGDPRPHIDQAGLYPRMLAAIFPRACNGLSLHKDFGVLGTVSLGRGGRALGGNGWAGGWVA